MHLLHAGSATLWAVIAGGAITALVVSGSFATIANVFKFLCLSLIAYVIVLAVSKVDWLKVSFSTLASACFKRRSQWSFSASPRS